jgi:hypothetical protein
MIGDGYGLLAALVKSRWPDAQLVMIDLGQSLLFQAVYCQKAHPQATHATAGSTDAANADFVYCASDRRRAIEAMTFDVAVNVASMQEMDPATVSGYFDFLRGHMMPANLFYCCNRESKSLPDGQVSAFAAYPWRPTDQVHLDGPCPWHQYYLTPRWTGRSPRILGLPLLGVSGYDGIHLHRLVTLGGE